jgi:hypothetical protein
VAEPEELLRRFAPQLRYDSQEAFFADSAAEWTDNPGNVLRHAPTEGQPEDVIAAATPGPGQAQLSLEYLGAAYPDGGGTAEPSDQISDSRRDYRDQYVALRTEQRERYANRMYGRAKEDSDGRLWLQYWFFYFYNDYNLAGNFGLHEGDWEMVQLRVHEEQPDLAVYAQHTHAEKATWDQVEKAPDAPDTPLVYVARGSHASYFTDGYHETEAWYDLADGKRHTPELTLEVVGDAEPAWVSWPGRWGDTKPRIKDLEQPSPDGPCRHKQWKDPKRLLEDARTHVVRDPLQPPDVTVVRAQQQLQLDFDFSHRPGAAPQTLVVTVNSVDDALPPRTFSFDVEGQVQGRRDTGVELNDKQRYDVYVSTTDDQGVPSASKLVQLEAVGHHEPGRLPIVPAIARAVAWVRGVFSRS